MEKVNFVQFKQVLDCSLLSTGPVLLEVGLADSASGQSAAQRRSSVGKSSTQSHGEKCALVAGGVCKGQPSREKEFGALGTAPLSVSLVLIHLYPIGERLLAGRLCLRRACRPRYAMVFKHRRDGYRYSDKVAKKRYRQTSNRKGLTRLSSSYSRIFIVRGWQALLLRTTNHQPWACSRRVERGFTPYHHRILPLSQEHPIFHLYIFSGISEQEGC